MDSAEILKEITSQAVHRMKDNTPRIAKCLDLLSEGEVWQKPNPHLNSIGNLILHLCGNITQYAISSIGHAPDNRTRDAEFAATGGFTKAELLEKLTTTVNRACDVIQSASSEELMRHRIVQGFSYTGIGNIIHVTEHYSYHTGQIAFWTKLIKDKDLGFYAGMDLNKKNE